MCRAESAGIVAGPIQIRDKAVMRQRGMSKPKMRHTKIELEISSEY
jgi:hypothetical protein